MIAFERTPDRLSRAWKICPLHDSRILERPDARRFLAEAGIHGTSVYMRHGLRSAMVGAVVELGVPVISEVDAFPRPGRRLHPDEAVGRWLHFASQCDGKARADAMESALALLASGSVGTWMRLGRFGEVGDAAPAIELGRLCDAVLSGPGGVDERSIMLAIPESSHQCAILALSALYRLGLLVGGRPTGKHKEIQ